MRTYIVEKAEGGIGRLYTDDTFTLAFGTGWQDRGESTIQQLAESISTKSLLKIARGPVNNSQDKARRALILALGE